MSFTQRVLNDVQVEILLELERLRRLLSLKRGMEVRWEGSRATRPKTGALKTPSGCSSALDVAASSHGAQRLPRIMFIVCTHVSPFKRRGAKASLLVRLPTQACVSAEGQPTKHT